MFDYKNLPSEMLKYMVIGVIILCMIIFIPTIRLSFKDTFILAILVTLSVAISEHVFSVINSPSMPVVQVTQSPTKISESMTDLSQTSTVGIDNNSVTSTTNTSTTGNTSGIVEKISMIPVYNNIAASTIQTTSIPQTPSTSISQTQPASNVQTGSVANISTTTSSTNTTATAVSDTSKIENDLEYTDYHHLPLSEYEKNNGNFTSGYSFLPPSQWYPPANPPFPPMCVGTSKCGALPTYTIGTPIDVLEWDSSRKILPPENLNVKYINDVLNKSQ